MHDVHCLHIALKMLVFESVQHAGQASFAVVRVNASIGMIDVMVTAIVATAAMNLTAVSLFYPHFLAVYISTLYSAWWCYKTFL